MSNFFSKKPFIGLRSFHHYETDIFFGRESIIDDLVDKLAKHHFLAVTGASGCGKSSLVNTGLIDALESGFMVESGVDWNMITIRPSNQPIENLAKALIKHIPKKNRFEGDTEVLIAKIRRSPISYINYIKENKDAFKGNLLIVIDQFEELFRYKREEDTDSATILVNLLLESSQQRDVPIYNVITMRSDFLGDCAIFEGLPEAFNQSQFLTPRLTREQCKMAIENPIAVLGGTIEPILVNHILNDIGTNPDQLPLMQHVLMRLWEKAKQENNEIPHLTLEAYQNIGGLELALSHHADEIFESLTIQEQKRVEQLFKCITEKDNEGRGIRRPEYVENICKVTNSSLIEIEKVCTKFNVEGVNFIVPANAINFSFDNILDITHESLIRQWKKLDKWVDEELKSALFYGYLENASILYQDGKGALWRNPDLEEGFRWLKKQKPSLDWVKRYGNRFELVVPFLEKSKIVQRKELRYKKLQKFLFILIPLVLIMGWLTYNTNTAKEIALQEKAKAEKLINMSFDLKDKLEPIGKLDILEDIQKNIGEYYEKDIDFNNMSAESINNIGIYYTNMGDTYFNKNNLEEASRYYEKSLELYTKINKNETLDNSMNYDGLGNIYQFKRDYPKALEYYKKALKIRRAKIKDGDINILYSYNHLGNTYMSANNFKNALLFYDKAVNMAKELSDKQPNNNKLKNELAKSYNHLGSIYFKTDKLVNIDIYRKALIITKELVQKDPNNTYWQETLGRTLINIANSYKKTKELKKSIELYEEALEIFKKLNYVNSNKWLKNIASLYNNIGSIYYQRNDLSSALDYYHKAIETNEKVLGNEDVLVINVYNNIGFIYQSNGELNKALEYFTKGLMLNRKIFGMNSLHTTKSYNTLGLLYESMGKEDKALEYLNKALSLNIKIMGKNNPYVVNSYINIGMFYQKRGDNNQSLIYFKKSLSINKKIFGDEHPNTIKGYFDIGKLYQNMNNQKEAFLYSKKAFLAFLKDKEKVFPFMNFIQRKKYLDLNSNKIDFLLESSYQYIEKLKKENNSIEAKNILKFITNTWINYKGIIFEDEIYRKTLFYTTKNKNLKKKISKFNTVQEKLAQLYLTIPKADEKDNWKEKINILELNISKIRTELNLEISSLKKEKINYTDIAKYLLDDELYIDFAKTRKSYYVFRIDSKKNINFSFINEGKSTKLNELIVELSYPYNIVNSRSIVVLSKNENTLEGYKNISTLIFQEKFLKKLKNKTKIIVSPNGFLNKVSFEALYDKNIKEFLIENNEINYIFNAKEFIRLKECENKQNSKNNIIFATSFYNKLNDFTGTKYKGNISRSVTVSIDPKNYIQDFSNLPATKVEVKNIQELLSKNKLVTTIYLNNQANKSNFFTIKQPKILHISGHTLFTKDKEINPSFSSGIVLSGINSVEKSKKFNQIITALEVSNLNLQGTELVVLSTCGSEEVDNSLVEAFFKAGARNVIMSFGKVEDEATKDLMVLFYKAIEKGSSYSDALREAKLQMIKDGRKISDWANFVLYGVNILANTNVAVSNSKNIEDINTSLKKSKLYAIVMDTGTDTKFGLKCLESNRESIKNEIENKMSMVFDKVELRYLIDENATKNNLLKSIQDILEKANIEDTFIFYISSHGISSNGDLYFTQYDSNQDARTWINFNDILFKIQSIYALNQIFIIDTSDTGIVHHLAKKVGVHMLLATVEGGDAYMPSSCNDSNNTTGFTQQILHTIKDKSTDINGDGFISVIELSKSLKNHPMKEQTSIFSNGGEDVLLRKVE